jgi:hypothetical protein
MADRSCDPVKFNVSKSGGSEKIADLYRGYVASSFIWFYFKQFNFYFYLPFVCSLIEEHRLEKTH